MKKNVSRFDVWINPIFAEVMGGRDDVISKVIERHGSDTLAWEVLKDTHFLHLSPAKDELPMRFHVNAAFISKCPNLLCVSSAGAGYDTINVRDCTDAGIIVQNQLGANSASVAEMTIGLAIAVSRKVVESDNLLRTERGFSRESLMGHDITGKTIGLVGLGQIGSRVAALAKAFGMRVLAYDPFLDSLEINIRGAEPVSLEELLNLSDIVSLHCPRNAETLKMFSEKEFFTMKPGAIFISTARGGIHDEVALIKALNSGHLSGAGLDVWEVEPPPLEHPLLKMKNVVATYHTAGVSHEGRRNVALMGANQIIGLFDGVKPDGLLNPSAWGAFKEKYKAIFGVSA